MFSNMTKRSSCVWMKHTAAVFTAPYSCPCTHQQLDSTRLGFLRLSKLTQMCCSLYLCSGSNAAFRSDPERNTSKQALPCNRCPAADPDIFDTKCSPLHALLYTLLYTTSLSAFAVLHSVQHCSFVRNSNHGLPHGTCFLLVVWT